jgi:hypothetical protein
MKMYSSDRPFRRKPHLFRDPVPHAGGSGTKECPASGDEVTCYDCARCEQFRVWKEGDVPLCRYEFEELMDSGFYSESEEEWLEHLKKADPDVYRELVEDKRNRERVLGEMENEKTATESNRENYAGAGNEQKNENGDEKDDETNEKDDDADEEESGENDEDEEFLF